MENPPSDAPSAPGAQASALLDAAGFRHAFFTREGGVSRPPWDTLNFAASVGDDPASVGENFRRAARALGVDAARLYVLSQVHGTESRALTGVEDRDEVMRSPGDITLSRTPGVACGVRSADCVPVLVADRRSGAVAAIHSGWRGTVAGAAAAGVAALRELIGAASSHPPELIAAIGPHIGACCFEVGEDVAASLAGCSAAGVGAVITGEARPLGRWGLRSAQRRALPPNPRVDLRRVVRAQLEAAGIAGSDIDDVPGCTVCEVSRYHSFRRDGARSGRLLSAIVAGARG